MKLMTLLTADYASLEQPSGKLHILGAFTRIYARTFPCTHRRMAVVVKLKPEFGDHSDLRELLVELQDEDGVELMRLSMPFKFQPGERGIRPEVGTVLEMNNLVFRRPGTYSFVVSVDGDIQGSASVELIPIEAQ